MMSSKTEHKLPRFILTILLMSGLSYGCARVEVQAPKDPIKMDISMRLDVYQHVAKDIDDIESLVSGSTQHAWAEWLVATAYAGNLSPEIESAAMRRRDRRASVVSALSAGQLGENNLGLLEARGSGDASRIASEENADRMIIYSALASRENVAVSEIQKVYAERLRNDAPGGSPVQGADGNWTTK